MPNTHLMQKITQMSFDYYLDNLENQATAEPLEPHYLCIPKGSPIPLSTCATLILYPMRHCYPEIIDSFP